MSKLYHREVGEYIANLNKNLKKGFFKTKPVKYITVGDLAAEIGNELISKGFEVENLQQIKKPQITYLKI